MNQRIAAVLLLALSATTARAQRGLEDLSLEELMDIDVTTVAGVRQDRFTTPSSIYVITPEDLRETGMRNLAEALRLVPGMFVGRGATSNWVVGARGLTGNGLTTTRSLVLIDGRVAYDPLFNGSPWDVLDIPLDDIERIEVVKGPGATLWGVNAVNGVINVITKTAWDTQGAHVRAAAGTADRFDGMIRYGGSAKETAYRVWGRYADTPSFDLLDGGTAHDDWTRVHLGFRLDLGEASRTTWTVEGAVYDHPTQEVFVRQPVPGAHIQFQQFVTDDDIDGGHLLVRAQRGSWEARGWSAHAYYDRSSRHTSRVGVRRNTLDFDFRRWSASGNGRHKLIWGAELFVTEDEIENGPTFIFDPTSRNWSVFNGFVQYTVTVVPERFHLMAGTKLTEHEFVDFELQPSLRAWWTPSERQTLWAGISRPVRVPSRLEENGFIVVAYADPGILGGGPPTGAVPFGVGPNPELESEELVAYELGYRVRPRPNWEVDVALYYNDFSQLIGIVSPLQPWTDAGTAEVHGGELSTAWRPSERLRLEGGYSWLDVDIGGPIAPTEEESVPEDVAQLRASWSANAKLGVHGAAYYVDDLPAQAIDSYTRLDVGVTWKPRAGLELALWGQNLAESEHAEASQVAIPRSGFLEVTFDW